MKTRTKVKAGGGGGIQLPPASNDGRTVSRFRCTFRVTDQNARDTRKEHIMTSLRCLAIAILVAAGSLQAQVSEDWVKAIGGITATNPPRRSSPTSNAVNRSRLGAAMAAPASLPVLMRARDLTYQVQLPAGWRPVVQPMLEYGLVFGTQGESLAMGMEDVYLDARMLGSILNPGYRAILPPAQFILKSRMAAPPMGPLEVVTRLLPHLAGGPQGAIQNLRVLRTYPGPQEFGFRQMLVVYQYTFVPRRDPAFASQAPPAVRAQAQVPMQAAAYVVTFPYLPGQFSWQFGYRILSAPQNVFQRNAPTYAHILQTFQVIPEGLRQKIKSNEDMAKLCASMNQITQQMAQNWGSDLGAGGELAGGDSQPPPSVGPPPAKGDSRPAQASCGFGAPPLTCEPNYKKLCCHSASGPDHFRCVKVSKALPAVVETSEEYGCTPVQYQ